MEKLTWEENLKARYEYEQALHKNDPMCSYCNKPVPAQTLQHLTVEEHVHLTDGRHFHSDCYQVYLIEKEQ